MKNQLPDWIRNPFAGVGIFALLLVLSFIISCRTLPRQKANLEQGWDQTHGLVIPHDNFPADCRLCHVPGSWQKIRNDFQFDHEARTGVPLLGAHREAQCLRCHNDRGPVAAFANKGCVGCHEDIHRGQLGPNCQSCHNLSNWTPFAQIALHNRTRFPLVGVHAGVDCQRCHAGADVGNFSRAPTRCALCHQQDLAGALNPHHKNLGWVDNCEKCHTPASWNAAAFSHTRFPLTGFHATTECNDCHKNHVFQGLSHDCFSCHAQEYQGTTMPNHLAAGFSTDCKSCHGTFGWTTSGLDHSRFPLIGAHATADCAQCHQNNIYAGLSHDCFSCHSNDYQQTTTPNHLAAGYSTDCKSCHNSFSWTTTLDHSRFPLTGAHAAVNCAQCHQNNVYAGLSHDCFSCHSNDYQQAANPNHVASGFPTACQNCHNTTSWSGATFNHTFNINSGPHKNFNCAECHQVPSNFMIASCTHCHEHRQSKMDDKHSGVSGYVWSSPACISCHPTGN